MLLDVVERHAGRPFLIDNRGGRTFTYAEAHAAAAAAADDLRARSVEPGDRVVLVLDNGPELALLYLACLYLGCVAVPVAPTVPLDELEYVRALVRPKLVLREFALAAGESRNPVEVDERRLFTITFTSGTTNRPKGVAQTVGSMLGAATAFGRELEYGPESRMLHVLPMTYMAGILNTLLCPFVAGASVVLDRPFDAQSLLDFWGPVFAHDVNTFWVAPTMLAGLIRLDRNPHAATYARTSIRTISVGTAALTSTMRREFERRYGVPLYESYGLSELLFISTGTPRFPNPAGSVGRLLPGVEVRFADDGELLVRTPFAMAGYLNDAGVPIAPPEWFPTGDLGRLDNAADLFITGRNKDLIIRGGINVSPKAVEDVLEAHKAVARAAVVGLPHALHGEEVVAVMELEPDRELEHEQPALVEHCRAHLAPAAVPTRFLVVDSLPVGPTGKIKKPELRAHLLARSH